MELSSQVTGLLFAAVALLGWTVLSFFVRASIQGAPLVKSTALLSTTNLLFLTPVTFFFVPISSFWPLSPRAIGLIITTGFIMVACSRLTYYFAIRRIGPSRTLPVATSTPVITAYMAAFALGEPVTVSMLAGMALLVLGVTVVVKADPAHAGAGPSFSPRERFWGYVAAGVTAVIWSLSSIMLKFLVREVHPLASATLIVWAGVPCLWILSRFDRGPDAAKPIPWHRWRWFALASISQSIAVPAYTAGLMFAYAVSVSSVTALQPILALIIAGVFLPHVENITRTMVLGACITVGGTLIVLLS